nr:iron ABC transporter permease [uncultured Cohaesibacter sp.]
MMLKACDANLGGYALYIRRKSLVLALLVLALVPALIAALSLGAAAVPIKDVVLSLIGADAPRRSDIIVWSIRLPQAVAAMLAGAGLAVSGAAMQSVLRNPLGSPFTLGISHAAAFGAALSVMAVGAMEIPSAEGGAVAVYNPVAVTLSAFGFSLLAAALITLIARVRGASPEVMVLTGVALGSLFTAGTMFLQFFADDVQLAAMVFWTFGDTARATWRDIGLIAAVTLPISIYFIAQCWNYNAIDAGDETAQGLGVRVERLRLVSMFAASLLTAVSISFLGIIGFVGLVVPHMVRRVIGADHRFLLPASLIGGALLLLVADTAARLVLSPNVLPVSVLTSFLGVPVFLWLILRGGRH